MSKVVKKVGGAIKDAGKAIFGGVKKVFEGVKKVFKKVWDSPIGKIIIIAAAVYLGGAALGAWASPWASVNGALVSGAEVSGAAGEAALAGGAAGDTLAAAGAAEAAGGGAALAAAGGDAALAANAAAATQAATGIAAETAAASTASQAVANMGIIDKVLAGIGKVVGKESAIGAFAKDNPLLMYAGMQGLGSAFTQTPAEAEAEMLRDRRNQYAKNTDTSGIDVMLHTNRDVARAREAQPTQAVDRPGYTPPTVQPIQPGTPSVASNATPVPQEPNSAGIIAQRLAARAPGRVA